MQNASRMSLLRRSGVNFFFSAASCRERPTSPSTEEAIQGMLSMAGLLCSSKPEKEASSQEPWWSSHSQCSPQHQRRLQGDKSPMDSQGNSSSEAWDNQETDYQYCDPSMSPPLHPSKRHAPNPPPISNQATKGLERYYYLLKHLRDDWIHYSLADPLLTPLSFLFFQANGPKKEWLQPSRDWVRS